ncbi:Cell death protease, partial [Blyttiomyces sp. JEL0837]
FAENGPVLFDLDGNGTHANPNSWHRFVNLVYVENPVGTGYSFTTGRYAVNEDEIAENFYTFLDGFFTVFPESKSYDLYIMGESYAGTYIPFMAQKLMQAGNWSDGTKINLKGIGLGNAYIDPVRQQTFGPGAPLYRDFYIQEGFFGDNQTAIGKWIDLANTCTNATITTYMSFPFECDLMGWADRWKRQATGIPCVNYYNVDQVCTETDTMEKGITAYLNRPDVRTALHVNATLVNGSPCVWNECSDAVDKQLHDRNFLAYKVIPRLLDAGLPILMYNGDKDAVCHYVGEEEIINDMTWNNKTGFIEQFPSIPNWIVGGQSAGYFQYRDGLTYVRVLGAGHMVPMDTPQSGVALLNMVVGLTDDVVSSERRR